MTSHRPVLVLLACLVGFAVIGPLVHAWWPWYAAYVFAAFMLGREYERRRH